MRPVLLAALTAAMLNPTLIEAQVSFFNGNAYEYVFIDAITGVTWTDARNAAAARTFNGVSGHLATVTSAAENAFLFGLGSTPGRGFLGAWLGGNATAGGWLTGPEAGQAFSYTGWGGIEPNNAGYTYMNIGDTFAGIDPGQWADDGSAIGLPAFPFDPVAGYFVEYQTVTVPEPGPLALVATSLLGLCVVARRRRWVG